MIIVKIDTVDKSSIVEFGSINKIDKINQKADSLSFRIFYHTGQTFRPEVGSEVEVLDGATTVFAGIINNVTKKITSNNQVIYTVRATDYTFDLNRELVVEDTITKRWTIS